MKKFLEDLKKELRKKNMKNEEINDIIADHEEMIQNALDEGLNETEIIEKFGNPKNLAEELADFSAKKNSEDDRVGSEDEQDYRLWKSFEVNDDLFNAEISLTEEDIAFRLSKDDKINILFNGKLHEDRYVLTFDDALLLFKSTKRFDLGFFIRKSENTNFIFEIPERLIADEFKFHSVSADIDISGIRANNLQISTTSGDMQITNVKFGDVKWHTVNGDIDVKNAEIKSLNASQVSGDVQFTNVTIAGAFHINTVSGDLSLIDSSCDELDLHTVSGDLDGREFYPKKVTLKAVSGDISITNKEKTPIEILKKSSVSGDISINN